MQANDNGEKLRNEICEYKEALCERIETMVSQGDIVINGAYHSFIVEKMKMKPEHVIAEAIDAILFILDSFAVYDLLEKLHEANGNGQYVADETTDLSKEPYVKDLYAKLSGYGISANWLVSHGLSSKQEIQMYQKSGNPEDFVYKRIKGGIRIDSTVLTGGVVVPEFIDGLPVTKIARNAFAKRKDITAVQLPQYLTEIEENAFADSGIIAIDIPNNVESIGECAFENCKQLQLIRLSQKLKVIKSFTFGGCRSLISIQVPDGTTAISEKAFDRCKKLEKIQIPDSVKRIGYAALPHKTVVYCNLGSRASRYVVDNDMPFYRPYEMYAND